MLVHQEQFEADTIMRGACRDRCLVGYRPRLPGLPLLSACCIAPPMLWCGPACSVARPLPAAHAREGVFAALSPVLHVQMGLTNSGAVAAAVAGWPRLRRLRLTACVNLGAGTLEAVAAHAPGLTFLDVSRCHNGMNSE